MATQNIYALTDTWNSVGTTFTGIGLNVTDTTSAATSMLIDLQVGGTTQFHVLKNGAVHTKRSNYNITSANTAIITASNYSLTGTNAQSLVDLSGTWDTSGTPAAIKLNITDTASNAASALMDLQVGGVSQFKVSKAGAVTAVGVAIPTISSTDTLTNKTLTSPTISGTVSGSPTFANEITATAYLASGTNFNGFRFYNSSGAANEKYTTLYTNGGNVRWAFENDARNSDTIFLQVNRSGITPTDINFGAGITVGAPTGGNKGAGTANFAADIYKNNSAFTNPDYVFEHFYRGEIVEFAANDGASEYAGLMPLEDLREFTRLNLHLPQVPKNGGVGIFERGDYLLRAMEESTLYILALHEQIKNLNQRLKELEQ